jgi:hypothetical protein
MKKTLLIIVAVFSLSVANAQTDKGKMLIGGDLSINGSVNDEYQPRTKRFDLSVNPKYGYFISKNFLIGTELNVNFRHTNQFFSEPGYLTLERIKTNLLGIGGGIFGRYYFRIIDNLRFFTNLDLNYNYTTIKKSTTYEGINPSVANPKPQFTHQHNASASLSPGLVYFMTPKLGIEVSFGSLYFNYYTTKIIDIPASKRGNSTEGGFSLNLSTLRLGLSYYF